MNETMQLDAHTEGRPVRDKGRTPWIGALVLALTLGAGATASGQETYVAQETPSPAATYAFAPGSWGSGESTQVPQDIRIMQRIVSTALNEVEAPPLPEELQYSGEARVMARSSGSWAPLPPGADQVSAGRVRPVIFGGRDVSGFYMPGYGYLFNVNWRLSGGFGGDEMGVALRAAEVAALAGEAERRAEEAVAPETAEARAAAEAREALKAERARLDERREAWAGWSASYRERLAAELRGVVAQYGSTLGRAQADESITFIADFGGGPETTATVTARRGDLQGVGREANLSDVQLVWGNAEVSDALRTELKIMAAIIDGSLESSPSGEFALVARRGWSSGNDDGFQFVPRYGVLFRRSARLNLATRLIQDVSPGRVRADVSPDSLRERIEESTAEQQLTYSEHLAELRRSSAELLATYGPTLTHMEPDYWVGLYYDVGSAAGLLQGGVSDYLVQARMSDIRQAASTGDPTSWLLDRLVTNEKQE